MSALPAMSADRILSTEALISLVIVDAITRRPLARIGRVTLRHADEGRPVAGLRQRELAGQGQYVWHGDPRVLADPLAIGPVTLEISASASGYEDGSVTISLGQGDGSFHDRTLERPYGDVNVREWAWLDSLSPHPLHLELRLEPQRIVLRGQVRDAASPFAPIAGALVSITSPGPNPPATSDANGFFAVSAVPRVPSITITVARSGFQTRVLPLDLDYGTAVNLADISMRRT